MSFGYKPLTIMNFMHEPECLLPSEDHKIIRNNNIGEMIKNGWSTPKAKREAVIHEILITSEAGRVLP